MNRPPIRMRLGLRDKALVARILQAIDKAEKPDRVGAAIIAALYGKSLKKEPTNPESS